MQITLFLYFMGVLRTEANKALGQLIAVLLCLCFCCCTAAPVQAVGKMPTAAKHAAEFKEAGHVPLALAVQEESGISLLKLLHSDKLLLAKTTGLVLQGLYPHPSTADRLLPAPTYRRVSLTDTILTTGP